MARRLMSALAYLLDAFLYPYPHRIIIDYLHVTGSSHSTNSYPNSCTG